MISNGMPFFFINFKKGHSIQSPVASEKHAYNFHSGYGKFPAKNTNTHNSNQNKVSMHVERERERERSRGLRNVLDTRDAFSQIDTILIKTNKTTIKSNSALELGATNSDVFRSLLVMRGLAVCCLFAEN